jgi:hypothetical protein
MMTTEYAVRCEPVGNRAEDDHVLHICRTHTFDGICMAGVCKAFCGAEMSGGTGTPDPPDADKCIVCMSMAEDAS